MHSAASLAMGDHRAPQAGPYEAWVSRGLYAARAHIVGSLVPILARSCRADLKVLPTHLAVGARRPGCFQCGETSLFEAWIWDEDGTVDETVCLCADHAFDLQCAWTLLRLPLAVYHSVRVRREWQSPAYTDHLNRCVRSARVAAHRLGIRAPSPPAADSGARGAAAAAHHGSGPDAPREGMSVSRAGAPTTTVVATPRFPSV